MKYLLEFFLCQLSQAFSLNFLLNVILLSTKNGLKRPKILNTRISFLRPSFVRLWYGKLWSMTNLLKYQNSKYSIFLFFYSQENNSEKKKNDIYIFFVVDILIFCTFSRLFKNYFMDLFHIIFNVLILNLKKKYWYFFLFTKENFSDPFKIHFGYYWTQKNIVNGQTLHKKFRILKTLNLLTDAYSSPDRKKIPQSRWADAFYKYKCPRVCVCVCLFIRNTFLLHLTVFLPPLPEVQCPHFLYI